jgi:hypothetical protein
VALHAGQRCSHAHALADSDKARSRKLTHSNIERKRRDRINEKIIRLRDAVPIIRGQDGMHKVAILEKAAEYIESLQKELAVRACCGGGLRQPCHAQVLVFSFAEQGP